MPAGIYFPCLMGIGANNGGIPMLAKTLYAGGIPVLWTRLTVRIWVFCKRCSKQ